jgi:hypothetical protein
MSNDPRLPPGTQSIEPSCNQEDAPRFRRWAESAENTDDFDALVAKFLADYGTEMMIDLVGCSGSLHRAASEYVDKLARSFEDWWDEGRPRLSSSRKFAVTYHITAAEREAHDLLEARLPPGAVFWVAHRMRRVAGEAQGAPKSQMKDWICRIEDGSANVSGEGYSAIEAATAALLTLQQFVSDPRVAKPPRLDAPSTPGAAKESEEKRVS